MKKQTKNTQATVNSDGASGEVSGKAEMPALPEETARVIPLPAFPIVGVGASAGGLAAFEAFFSGMPTDKDPGMAFVLVQHLAPDHKSILTDLVQRYTRMQVFEVEDGMPRSVIATGLVDYDLSPAEMPAQLMAISVQDLEGRILAWNPGAERIYGWSEAEALKLNIRDLIPGNMRQEALGVVKRPGRADVLEPYRMQRIAKDGHMVEVWLTATALVNETGQVYAIATTERERGLETDEPGRKEGAGR